MSKTPSYETLCSVVTTDSILQALGIEVKALPTVTRCQLCNRGKMTVLDDSPGMYAVCNSCGFRGDGFELLKAKYRIDTVEMLLWQLERDGNITSRTSVPDDAILDYEIFATRQEMAKGIVRSGQNNIRHMQTVDTQLLSMLRLMPSSVDSVEWQDGVARYCASVEKQRLSENLDVATNMIPGSNPLLILPYYSMPGRIASMKVLYRRQGTVQEKLVKLENDSTGLFMVDTFDMETPSIVAMSDPIELLNIQKDRAVMELKPLPIVGYNSDTKHWPVNPNQTVVFWGAPDFSMFAQAKKVPNSRICSDKSNLDYSTLMRTCGSHVWFQRVVKESKPWQMAMKDYLLSVSEPEAADIIKKLALTPMEIGEVVYHCEDDDQRKVIENMVENHPTVRRVNVNGRDIVEKSGCWYLVNKNGRMNKLTDFTFKIHSSVHYDGIGTYFVGTFSYDGRSDRFVAPMERFMDNAGKWLRQFAVSNGIGFPVITPKSWSSKLIDVALSFQSNKIEHIERSAKVGWTQDFASFRLPTVVMTNGKIDKNDPGIPVDDSTKLPGYKCTTSPVSKLGLKAMVSENTCNTAAWALYLAIAHNVLAPYMGWPRKRIVVAGPTRFLEAVSDAWGLQYYRIPETAAKFRSNIGSLEKTNHDLPAPMVYEGQSSSGNPFYRWLTTPIERNVIISMPFDHAAMVGGTDWMFIPVLEIDAKLDYLEKTVNLIRDIPKLVKGPKDIDKTKAIGRLSSRTRRMVKERLVDIEERLDIIQKAEELIRYNYLYGGDNAGRALLYGLFHNMHIGTIILSNDARRRNANTHVLMRPDKVIIKSRVMNTINYGISPGAVEAGLRDAGILLSKSVDGLTISKDSWNEYYEDWKQSDSCLFKD